MSLFNKPGSSAAAAVAAKPSTAPQAKSAPVQLTGLFSGISQAKPILNAEYIRPGHYVCRINCCKVDKSRKNIVFCAVEMTVVHAIDDLEGRGHRVGSDITWYNGSDSDYFLSELQGFCAGVLGCQPAEVSEEHAMQIFGPENPLANIAVEVRATNIVTKKNTDFTRVNWVREVPASEMLGMDQALRERFWPGGMLERLAEIEKGLERLAEIEKGQQQG